MAHFAQLTKDNIVTQVIVIHNNELLDENGVERESKGQQFCTNLLGGTWVQTSYSATLRKNYASIGFAYDIVRDAFIPPKLYPSWILNESTCQWEAPIAYPSDGKLYKWDESAQSWVLSTLITDQ
jgi:hypothetical protein